MYVCSKGYLVGIFDKDFLYTHTNNVVLITIDVCMCMYTNEEIGKSHIYLI